MSLYLWMFPKMCLKLYNFFSFVNVQGKEERGLTLERRTGKGFQGTEDVQ